MVFVHRDVVRLAVDLTGAREYDFDVLVVVTAGFENGQLRSTIDFEVRVWVLHGVQVARLACKVEEIVLPLNQVTHAVLIPHGGDINPWTVSTSRYVKKT